MSERRFGRVIVTLVALGFAALLAAGAGAALVVTLGQDQTRWVGHTYQVEGRIDDLRVDLARMEAARRGFLLNRDPSFVAIYTATAAAMAHEIDTLRQLTADNPNEIRNLAVLKPRAAALRGRLDASLAEMTALGGAAATRDFAADGSVQLAREVQQTLTTMHAEEEQLLQQRLASQRAYLRAFFFVLVLCAVLVVLVAVGSVLVILRYTRDLAATRDSLRDLNDNLELAVQERTVDLQRANDEIQRFAYIVSHDLRSPLVNVLGFTAELDASAKPIGLLLERAEADAPSLVTDDVRRAIREDVPEAIGFIRTSTEKMDRLINAILKLSREGRRMVAPEPLNMDALVQTIADSLRHRVAAAGAEIVVETPLPSLMSDRVAVEQILSNLVENAVKYLKPGRPGRIVVRGRREHAKAVYEIADNGRGIDPKDHERIFDLFRRSGAQDQPGEGIGLAHVRASAYRLGGIVSCESTLGEGATFRLSLPAVYAGESKA